MSTREEVLREFDTGANRLLEAQIDDVKVRLFEGFAIVTGRTHARGEYGGQKYDVTLRFTDVFVRRNQQWQAVASHACLIPTDNSR
jgi:CTP:phosphocholine cytidylyltransferase-like protein